MAAPLKTVLGIETSCDETAVGIVRADRTILANVVLSQIDLHRPYGGVVPEIAARSHLGHLEALVRTALAEANMAVDQLDGIAATAGPGLIGGLLVGTMAAKGLAAARDLPYLAINHLEGHALTARLTDGLAFPYLLLLVSGGHCQLLAVEGVGCYRRLGTTVDDAVGEAFDKVAKILGLGYPGGPRIEAAARQGDAARFALPSPMVGRPDCHFSFSGLKAAVKRLVDRLGPDSLTDADVRDLAAAFQHAVGDSLVDRTLRAMSRFRDDYGIGEAGGALVVAGGVAANQALRARLRDAAEAVGMAFVAPPAALCTDNGAMIAWAGLERLDLGLVDGLDFRARPRWPLDPEAPPAMGAGVKA